jgi:hypothetical protein
VGGRSWLRKGHCFKVTLGMFGMTTKSELTSEGRLLFGCSCRRMCSGVDDLGTTGGRWVQNCGIPSPTDCHRASVGLSGERGSR